MNLRKFKIIVHFKLIFERCIFAYHSLITHKHRSFLSLLGTTIGNFIIISTTIGLISGYIPAWTAASLDPVKAIATTF